MANLLLYKIPSFFLISMLFACGAEQPDTIGLNDGVLSPCPESPNCVQTYNQDDKKHYMDPLPMKGSLQETNERLIQTVESMARTEILTKEANYIHATYTTAVFRFIDDVEFLIDQENNLVHFRSASRVGYSDLGVNSRRMNKFRKLYEED